MGKPKTRSKPREPPINLVLNPLRQVFGQTIKVIDKSIIGQVIKAIDEKIITAVIALLFTFAILGITLAFGYRYVLYGNPQDIDAIKTLWAVLGTPYGFVLGYYFIK